LYIYSFIDLLIPYLLITAVNSSHYTVSNDRMISKYWIEKHREDMVFA